MKEKKWWIQDTLYYEMMTIVHVLDEHRLVLLLIKII